MRFIASLVRQASSLGVYLCLSAAISLTAAEPAAKKPNIIFILADDLGYGDLGVQGSTHIRTPNLDRLAAQGTRFTHAYAGSAACAPSRCVLMTGLHTGHAVIRDNSPRVGGKLEPYDNGREGGKRLSMTQRDVTVATLLKRAGYATGISGKWGLGEEGSEGTPTRHGFDEWLGYLNQNHAAYYYTTYLDENDGRRELPGNADGKKSTYSNDVMADFMIDFVRRHRDGPFFLYMPFTIPHDLMEVPEVGEYAKERWPEDAKIYAAMVSRLDGYVGRLLAELDRLGIDDNTVVFFSSDNGPAPRPRGQLLKSAADLRGTKFTLYEGGIRVPMLVRWPGRVPAARTSEEPWMFVDFLPTCLQLAGAALPGGLDGESVVPLLLGQATSRGERSFYWELPKESLEQAARIGRWKAVRKGRHTPPELFDLQSDPGETANVASSHPEVVRRMKAFLDSSHQPSPHWPESQ